MGKAAKSGVKRPDAGMKSVTSPSNNLQRQAERKNRLLFRGSLEAA